MRSLEIVQRQIDQAFDKKSWHGTNLRGSLRGITAQQAAWRPQLDAHNIWELTLHAAYWKYTVRRRIEGGDKGGFPLKGSNFFLRPVPGGETEARWKADVALLVESHTALRHAVASLPVDRLEKAVDGKMRLLDLAIGVAAHDVYHAGQIQLIKRLMSHALQTK